MATGTAAVLQSPQETAATGRMRVLATGATAQAAGAIASIGGPSSAGTAAVAQSPQETAATGRMRVLATGATAQAAAETAGTGAGLIVGTCATVQGGRQRMRGAGFGPTKHTRLYLRVPRENTGTTITL